MAARARLDRRFLLGALLLGISVTSLLAETVTLPVAASVSGVGGVPFVSDVRVFNASYTDVQTMTAVCRFNGAVQMFQLGPREAKAFDDICASLFGSPGSLGAVEFTASSSGALVVSSQLRSPFSGGGFVGMFVPGLPSSSSPPSRPSPFSAIPTPSPAPTTTAAVTRRSTPAWSGCSSSNDLVVRIVSDGGRRETRRGRGTSAE
jgi:hypothetical protein